MHRPGSDDELVFAPEADAAGYSKPPWRLLIVDDEEEIHRVTKMALADFTLDGRPLEFIDAYTGREAVGAMLQHPDTALVLMDVVMETEHAGLDAVDAIRNNLGNKLVRIVLRTGQPGQAPERDIVMRYDINDYREKTELTAKKLFTVVYTGLQLYQDMAETRKTREGIERIVDASSTIFLRRLPQRLGKGALQLLASVLGVDQTREPPAFGAFMTLNLGVQRPEVLVGIGRFAPLTGRPMNSAGVPDAVALFRKLRGDETWTRGSKSFTARIVGPKQVQLGIHFETDTPLVPLDGHVLDVFCRNVVLALHAAQLNRDLDHTQQHLITTLGEAIEKRSRETGNHVRRVGEYSRIVARRYGLNEEDSDVLLIAAALHDAGKIAIPDSILTKPGKLTPEERAVMETHAEIGAEMFAGQDMPVLKAAMIIASQHHEHWDGLGYPRKLKGEQIHLYGRIVAIADVFDALSSHRCYKKAWPLDEVVATLKAERSRHFDPELVDLFLNEVDAVVAVQERLRDPEPEPAAAA